MKAIITYLPILVIAFTIYFHFTCHDYSNILKWGGIGLQIWGSIIIVICLNQNMKELSGSSLLTLISHNVDQMLGYKKSGVITLEGIPMNASIGVPTLKATKGPPTYDEQIAQLKEEMAKMRTESKQQIDAVRKEMQTYNDNNEQSTAQLRSQLVKTIIGDYGLQLSGVVSVVIGTILAVL